MTGPGPGNDHRRTRVGALVLTLAGLATLMLMPPWWVGILAVLALVVGLAALSATSAHRSTEVAGHGGRTRLAFTEPGECSVWLHKTSVGDAPVVEAVRQVTGLPPARARALLGRTPLVLAEGRSRASAERIRETLAEAGAVAEVHGPAAG